MNSRFLTLKKEILGKNYELGLKFVSKKKIRAINQIYRQKNDPTDILVFPLSKKTGDMVICLTEAKKKAALFKKSQKEYLNYLIIHGLLHLKGLKHGKIMTKLEKKYGKKYSSGH